MTKVVVTGAGGFIGGWLVKRLLEEGHQVRGVDIKPLSDWYQLHKGCTNLSYNLTISSNVATCFKDQEVVYNLAANMGGMGYLDSNRIDTLYTGEITYRVFAAAHEFGLKIMQASSACVYPDFLQHETEVYLKESMAWPADPEPCYGFEKLLGEQLAEWFHRDHGLDVRVARFHNIMGPYGTYDGGKEKAPSAICRKVAQAALGGPKEIEIWGDGEQTRSFMYVDECLEGVQRLMESDFTEPLNVGSAELVTINQLVDMVEEIAGIRLHRTYNLDAPQGVRGRCSDNTLCQEVLGWAPSARLADGLNPTYEWIYNQMKGKQND